MNTRILYTRPHRQTDTHACIRWPTVVAFTIIKPYNNWRLLCSCQNYGIAAAITSNWPSYDGD
jgi:hypothetical protein